MGVHTIWVDLGRPDWDWAELLLLRALGGGRVPRAAAGGPELSGTPRGVAGGRIRTNVGWAPLPPQGMNLGRPLGTRSPWRFARSTTLGSTEPGTRPAARDPGDFRTKRFGLDTAPDLRAWARRFGVNAGPIHTAVLRRSYAANPSRSNSWRRTQPHRSRSDRAPALPSPRARGSRPAHASRLRLSHGRVRDTDGPITVPDGGANNGCVGRGLRPS